MFNPDNWVWRNVARAADVLILSICWLFCSLPLFTCGAATAALYHTLIRCVRGEAPQTFLTFFRSFKENFKASVPLTLIVIGVELLLFGAYTVTSVMAQADVPVAKALLYADGIVMCVPLAIWLMGILTLSRFTFRAKELLITAVSMTFGHLPTTLLVTVLVLFAGLCCYALIALLAILPGLIALLISFPMERVLRKYEPTKNEREEA